MARKTTRSKVFICNVVIAALCLLSIAAYFFMPLWKVKLSYALTTDTVGEIIADANDSLNEDTQTGADTDQSIAQTAQNVLIVEGIELTPEDLVGEDGITLSVDITLKTTDVFRSLSGNAEQTVQKILDANVDSMVDQIIEPMNKVVKNVAKAASKQALKLSVKEQVHNAYSGEKTPEEIEQLLESAEITEAYINEKVETLIESLYAPDATVQDVTYQVTTTVEEVFDKLAQTDPYFADKNLTTTQKEEIESLVEETLDFISSDGGDINMEEFLAQLVLDAIQGNSSQDMNGGETTGGFPITGTAATVGGASVRPMAQTLPSNEPMSATEELKWEIRSLLAEQIPAETAEIIATALQAVSYLLFFTFFAWLYLIIKMLAKSKKVNNAIKLKFPIVLGWIPFLVLWILPTIAFAIVKSQSAKLGLGATAAAQFKALSLSFSSASVFSFLIAVALIVFALSYYSRLRKKMKLIGQGKAFDRGYGATSYAQPVYTQPLNDVQYVHAYANGDVYENDYDNDNYYGS